MVVQTTKPNRWYADALVAGGLAALLFGLLYLGTRAPETYITAGVDLDPEYLPYYAVRSVLRMLAAYALALIFTLAYGYKAAYNPKAERVMIPILDILQSVPVLSFMPSVVLALVGLFPDGNIGPELASIVLIFTGQVWNMTFSFYHSLKTIPTEFREVAATFQMSPWRRFRELELPFSATGLVWNSMMSWAGGWFFLMACEMFTLGDSQFILPGLGSYLQAAADAGNIGAVIWGVTALVVVIVLLDQLVWRPVIAWAEKFKVGLVSEGASPRSTVLTLLRRSQMVEWLDEQVWKPCSEWVDQRLSEYSSRSPIILTGTVRRIVNALLALAALFLIGIGIGRGVRLLSGLSLAQIPYLALASGASLLRVTVALLIGLAWTIPVGVAIGSNHRVAAVLQPITQILASIPATALFPILLLFLLNLPGGLNLAAVILLLLGTQWYLLFNIIAGTSAIPADLKEASHSLGLRGWERWRTLILPGIFPHLVTGLVTASGGAWNATIVSEYVQFRGQTHQTVGLGAAIAQAATHADFPMLLAATLVLAVVVVAINRLLWRRLYRLAETRFRLE